MNAIELVSAGTILGLYVILTTAERFRPRNSFPVVKGWIFVGLGFVGLLLLINATVALLIPAELLIGFSLIDGRELGVAGGALFGTLVISFLDYWYHRASHRFNWLWRAAHQLHHSAERVDTIGFVYTHPLEITIFAMENVVVLQILFRLEPTAVAVTGVLIAFCGMYQHWNVKTPRWTGYIIQRPESHCYHHELNVHASNYSNIPIWDIVFGTFRNPRSFEGAVGFEGDRGKQFWRILLWQDVNKG